MSRQLPRRAVMSIRGVGAALTLALTLLGTTAHAGLSDVWITVKAKAALFTTKGVSATAISVDTADGQVTLNGKVPSETARSKAETVVKSLDGVQGVDNRLIVAAGEAPPLEGPPSHEALPLPPRGGMPQVPR